MTDTTAAREELRGMALSLATGTGPLVEPHAFDAALDAHRTAVLREAADHAETVALRLRLKHDVGAANGAYKVMEELRRLADETPATETTEPRRPCRAFVSGGTVWCCEEGETDCPCICHQPAAGARQDGAQS